MARVKITEHRAKTILSQELGIPFTGLSLNNAPSDIQEIKNLSANKKYVLKVDEGVKGRMKKGLVVLNKGPKELITEYEKLKKTGYTKFIIEELVPHAGSEEKFLSFERLREGVHVYYSNEGGIDIEQNKDKIKKALLNSNTISSIANDLSIDIHLLEAVRKMFDEYYVSFLEINPLVVKSNQYYLLDLAVEVDSTALFFTKKIWRGEDVVTGKTKQKTEEETAVAKLAENTPAALSLEVLNPDGSIWVLLSGGGVSVTLADEIYNLGYGKELGNYGEYSGNPNEEETYIYTQQIISLLLKSKAKSKILVIGGGVANFTDVSKTFKGVIKSLHENGKKLKKSAIKVFVRRGGPMQEKGLLAMRECLEAEGIYGHVQGPELALPKIVKLGIRAIE